MGIVDVPEMKDKQLSIGFMKFICLKESIYNLQAFSAEPDDFETTFEYWVKLRNRRVFVFA